MAGAEMSSVRAMCFPSCPGSRLLRVPRSEPAWCVHMDSRAASRTRHGTATFLSWEVSSHSLASLAAELPEDKGSDYKADQGPER